MREYRVHGPAHADLPVWEMSTKIDLKNTPFSRVVHMITAKQKSSPSDPHPVEHIKDTMAMIGAKMSVDYFLRSSVKFVDIKCEVETEEQAVLVKMFLQ
jgi:hypothetical protein